MDSTKTAKSVVLILITPISDGDVIHIPSVVPA
jgi:hypothetical protein